MNKYDKITYWGNRVDPNNENSRSVSHKQVEWVKPFLSENDNLLDYGPGVGRLSDTYKSVESVTFYDITNKYKDKLLSVCENDGVNVKNFIIDTSGEIKTPFSDLEFDVVLCSEVLLHVPENEIIDVMIELSRIGKKVIVNTWYENSEVLSTTWCFTRDYKKIVEDNDLELLFWEVGSFDNQLCFIYKTKDE